MSVGSVKEKQPHEGHRQRLKQRFLNDGFDSFEPHNVLEMALFYCFSRRDTNELAHELLNRFGSIAGVCEAPFESLCQVPGIGREAAIYLKMLPEFARMYMQSKQAQKVLITSPESAVAFFEPRFIGRTNEVFMAAFLNARGELLSWGIISEGSDTSVVLDVKAVTRRAFSQNAYAVVVAHNHPNGFAVPSAQDIKMTDELAIALSSVDIKLCDHIIFSRDEHIRMARNQKAKRQYFIFN